MWYIHSLFQVRQRVRWLSSSGQVTSLKSTVGLLAKVKQSNRHLQSSWSCVESHHIG